MTTQKKPDANKAGKRAAAVLRCGAVRRLFAFLKSDNGGAAFFLLAAFLFVALPYLARADQVTTTFTGTISSTTTTKIAGTTTDGISRSLFGMPPGTIINGMPFTIVYTVNNSLGTSTSTATTSNLVSTATGNPITAVVTINGGSENYGNCGSCNVNGTSISQTASSTTEYYLGENHYVGYLGGSSGVGVSMYFSNPPYANPGYYPDALSYTTSAPGTKGTGTIDYSIGYDAPGGVGYWTAGVSPDASLNVDTIVVSGPSPPPTAPTTTGNNYGCTCPPQTTSPTFTPVATQNNYSPPVTTGGMSLPSTNGGDPISAGTGNTFVHETDFVGGPNTQLSFMRTYNSMDQSKGPLGIGWHSTYHRGLALTTSTAVTVTRADGRQDIYTKSGSNWTPEANVTSVLSEVTSGGTQTGWELSLPDDSIEDYSLSGVLTTITSPRGLITTLSYTTSNLTTVTGPFGQTLTFLYDALNRVTTMSVPDGNKFIYAYDQYDNLRYVQHPDANMRIYEYSNVSFPNIITGLYDEYGNETVWTYDSTGRALSSALPNGVQQITLAYTSTGVTTMTDALGNSTSYDLTTNFGLVQPSAVNGTPFPAAGGAAFGYDGNGFPDSVTDFNGNVTQYTFNSIGEATSITEGYGSAVARTTTVAWDATFHLPDQISQLGRTTSYTYDASGNVLTVSVTDGTNTRNWTYTYNASSLPISATDALGNTTSYTYDSLGNRTTMKNALGQVTTYTYNADGWLVTAEDANNLTTTYTYDDMGRVLTKKIGGTLTTTWVYNAGAGRPSSVTYPDGTSFTYTYDPAERLIQVKDYPGNTIKYTYDIMSNLTGVNVYDISGNLKLTTTASYGPANRLLTVNGAALGETTTFTYDDEGNVLGIVDPLGDTTSYAYDALNRRVSFTDALGNTSTTTYDVFDNVTEVLDPLGLTTTYNYDGIGDNTGVESPDSGTTSYTYDSAGNLITTVDALSQTTTYMYDALNRTTTMLYAGSGSVSWLYDTGTNAIGHLSKMTDLAATTSYTWDQYGRILTKKQTTGTVALTSTYTYDSHGRPNTFEYPSTRTITYLYDSGGRVYYLSAPGVEVNTFLPFGPPVNVALANATTMGRNYDQDGRITSISLNNTTTAANTQTITYDNASRITSLAETGLTTKTYGYDADNRLTSFFNGTTTTSWTFDDNGNRLSSTLSGTTTYNYSGTSNILNSLSGVTTTSYTYNSDGNLTTDGTHTWTLDGRERATQVLVGTTTTAYGVNGFGQRVTKSGTGVPNGGTNEYVYDEQGHLIGEYGSTGTIVNETLYLPDTPVSVYSRGNGLKGFGPNPIPVAVFTGASGGTISSMVADNLNIPHIIQNSSKQTIWWWQRYPYSDNSPNPNPYGYGNFVYNAGGGSGQYYDSETGTFQNGMRDYYSGSTGRYWQFDLLGLGGGSFSPYAYVYNNPLTWVDPDGLDPQKGGRGDTGGSSGKQTDNPYKHCKLDRCDPNFIICKDNHTGKTIRKPKPPDWEQYKFSPLPDEPSPSLPVPVPAPTPAPPSQLPQWMQPKPWWLLLPWPGNPLYEGL